MKALTTWIGIAALTLTGAACQYTAPSTAATPLTASLDLHLNTPTTRLYATSPTFIEVSRTIVQGTKLPYGGCLQEVRPQRNDGTSAREVEYDPATCRSVVAVGHTIVATASTASNTTR